MGFQWGSCYSSRLGRRNVREEHTCTIDPESIEMVCYLSERKTVLMGGFCNECGLEMLRAIDLIYITDDGCSSDECCQVVGEEGEGGAISCEPTRDSVGPLYGTYHQIGWSCAKCDCEGGAGPGTGFVYEEDNENNVEFWSGDFFSWNEETMIH